MKLMKLFRTHLIIVLLCGMVIGLGMPDDAEAGNCAIYGYVVGILHFDGTLTAFSIREKPIDAGMWTVQIGPGPLVSLDDLAMYNTIRSAHQNNTKLAVLTTIAGLCPTPNLSLPGTTFAGTLAWLVPPN